MPSAAAVASVRSALGNVLGPVKMCRAGPSVPRGTENLYVVYEVTLCHNLTKVRIFQLLAKSGRGDGVLCIGQWLPEITAFPE